MKKPYWADLHNHNAVGYGKGSLDRSYAIARGALLDAYCFTPHGHWHDLPQNDHRMVEYHRKGFERVRQAWPEVKQKAEAEYRPGSFVTFFGYEWHSSEFGDYHLLFTDPRVDLVQASKLEEMADHVRRNGGIMVPHHVGYRTGWRGANWPALPADVVPLVDVFSEHGCSMESESHWPMLRHSMGGVDRSQTVIRQLEQGLVTGLTASTDNHHGHPACCGEGLTGIWADARTRETVFDAFRRRHTFAVTGDRIGLTLALGDSMMGDVVPAGTPRELRYAADACGAIDSVRVLKNGRIAHAAELPGPGSDGPDFVARLSFGWDAMTSAQTTVWRIRVSIAGGELQDVLPAFAGGAGSVERVNAVESIAAGGTTIAAFTARGNSRPVSEVVLRVGGDAATRIRVDVNTERAGEEGECRLDTELGTLLERDAWAAVSDVFSAPRIRLGQLHACGETRLEGEWLDGEPAEGDWYLLRVQQRNGHIAWSSPIWCREEPTWFAPPPREDRKQTETQEGGAADER